VAGRLLGEVRAKLGGRLGSAEEMAGLAYLDQVVKEVLRLYATVGIIPRVALEPVVVDGYGLPAGTILGLTPYVLHRRPELHPRPFEFRPERFDPEAGERLAPLSYLPFGAGHHTCIGQPLAVMLMKLVVVATLRRYSLELLPGQAMYERFTATQEIGLRLLARVGRQDGAWVGARARIKGDAVGACPGPRPW
jgi:cytochrome P450